MKKLLLFGLMALSVTAFAQLRKDRTNTQIGGDGAIDNGDGSFKMAFNFTSDLDYGKSGSDNNFKAFQSIAISSEAPVGMADVIKGKKTNKIGSGANFHRIKDIPELLSFATADTLPIWSPVQEYWKEGNFIVDLDAAATDQVWINYPGMYKRSIFALRANLTNIGVIGSDLSFELLTYDTGNSGKTAQYKMIVELGGKINNGFGNNGFKTVADLDTITAANVSSYYSTVGTDKLYVVDSIYATTTDSTRARVKINVAQAIGMTTEEINGNYVAVMLYTSGTGTNIAPGIFEPVLGVDNIEVSYIPASWVVPANATSNAYINHNNGAPVVTTSDDFSGGNKVEVTSDTESPIKILLTSINRTSDIVLTEDNTDKYHNAKFAFPTTGAVKSKDASGQFTVDVPYTLVESDGTTVYKLTIPMAEGAAYSNDTLEVTLNATIGLDVTSSTRLEITNGTRIWYNIGAIGVTPSAAPVIGQNALRVTAFNSSIYAYNAEEDVYVTNLAGQTVKIVSPELAKKGIQVSQGAYVVKTGKLVQKVVVQ
ncbi:MAG: hypothetical protein PHS59_13885 [Paludibacter sp.]|nr:hypothetical protein [Paludibacter sp.]